MVLLHVIYFFWALFSFSVKKRPPPPTLEFYESCICNSYLARLEDYNVRFVLICLFDSLLIFTGFHGWVPSHASLVVKHIKQPLLKPPVSRYPTTRLRLWDSLVKSIQQNWEGLGADVWGHFKTTLGTSPGGIFVQVELALWDFFKNNKQSTIVQRWLFPASEAITWAMYFK